MPQRKAQAHTPRDSVRGTISLAGPAEVPIASLDTKDGRSLRIAGSLTMDVVRQLAGLEIVAYGPRRARADDPVDIETFRVRAVGDVPAIDGILRRTENGDFLELPDGRLLTLPNIPGYLFGANAKRVWIAGPLENPTGVGVIDPDRHYDFRRRIPIVYDSARGTVSLTGSCNGGFTMLSLGNDRAMILEGSRVPLRQLRGFEIVVFGLRHEDTPFRWPVQEVDSFFVRAIDSTPALDGTLRRDGGSDVLELRDGSRVKISRLPDRLANANGERVWIAGSPDAPIAASVIDPKYRHDCAE